MALMGRARGALVLGTRRAVLWGLLAPPACATITLASLPLGG